MQMTVQNLTRRFFSSCTYSEAQKVAAYLGRLSDSFSLERESVRCHVLSSSALGRGFSLDSSVGSRVTQIASTEGFSQALVAAEEKKHLVVADFTAQWCGPCRAVAPVYESLSREFPQVTFLKVDIDEDDLRPVVEKHNIKAVPTFVFYKNRKIVAQFSGGDSAKLREMVSTLSVP